VSVEFTIPGRVTSANLVTRHMGLLQHGKAVARAYKPKDAVEDMARIKSLAFAAKVQQGWNVPEQARVTILCFNSGLDVGNVDKVISDAIKGGVLIIDDRKKHCKSLFVEHQDDDHLGERYVVRVEAVHPGLPL
jgi:hypothetical protein